MRPLGARARRLRRRGEADARQAHLVGDPVRSADPVRRVPPDGGRYPCGAHLDNGQRLLALSLEGVDHIRRSQADRRHVLPARFGDAGPWLRRRDHDAFAAGVGLRFRRIPAAGSLQSDLLRARHDHDLFRGDAVRDRADEFRRAAATRRAGRRLSDFQLGELLADGFRRAADQHFASGRRIFPGRLDGLSASFGTQVFAGSRSRLLLLAPQISGLGTLLTGVNFVTTILKIRAPGMILTRMPIFCWTALASNLLIVAAFPILTATLAMLLLDRYLGFHFFSTDMGGNPMLYVSLFWTWGHPEVYILILPAFGVFSEVVSTFSRKPLFGYRSMVVATMAICILSFMVWLHHFFTMGAGADVNSVFAIMSMIIAVPTGVKVFNWLFTMFGGRIVYATPMLYAIGFMVTFVIGGLTGVLTAVPP